MPDQSPTANGRRARHPLPAARRLAQRLALAGAATDGPRHAGRGPAASTSARQGEDDYRHRMTMNVLGLVVTTILVVVGVWLAVSIAEMRKNQDCCLQGRTQLRANSTFRRRRSLISASVTSSDCVS